MRKLLGWILIGAWLALGLSAENVWAKKKAKSTPAAKSNAKTAKKSAGSSAKKGATKRSKGAKKAAAPRKVRQAAPTPERYKEIQQALAAKGFLSAEDATGVWGASSVNALKRFQEQQSIAVTGKINSLSLIALGLGPKREALTAKTPEPPSPQN